MGRRRVRARPRTPRRARDLGADGTAAGGPRRAAQVGVPALPARRTRPLTAKARGVQDLEDLDVVFGALAHRSRRTILSTLQARGGSMTSGAIASRFECAWPTTTRHLRVLEAAGLVRVELHGRERVYRIDTDRLRRVRGFLDRTLRPVGGRGLDGPRPPTHAPHQSLCTRAGAIPSLDAGAWWHRVRFGP